MGLDTRVLPGVIIMASFTCNTCRVAFADADLQREHYRCDWHRYNLKRKVAEMAPVTLENFQQRVKAQTAQEAEDSRDKSSYCELCRKPFNTEKAYTNHIGSKKHKETEAKAAKKTEELINQMNALNTGQEPNNKTSSKNQKNQANMKAVSKDSANEAIKASIQAGCSAGSSTASTSGIPSGVNARNLPASSASRQKAIPEDDSDSEWEDDGEEEEWDGEALGEDECLFCSYVSSTPEVNVQHMTRHHSFFIPDIEYLSDMHGLLSYLGQKVGEGHVCLWCNEKGKQFHTTKSVQQHMLDKGHCKMLHDGDAVYEYADFYDYRSSYPDFEEHQLAEAAGGAGAPPEGEDGEEEEEVDLECLEEDNYQLVLPSGASIGHRSLQRYYRQKLKPTKYERNPSAVSRVMAQYKALGWTGTVGADAQKRAKDVAFVKRMRARQQMAMGMKNNKILQPHLRPQVVF